MSDASAAVPAAVSAPIVCFSHLRWHFVYQRPQHLLSRLARHQPVLFVEEPCATDGEPGIELREGGDGVRVAVPRLPAAECHPGHAAGEARLRRLLDALLARLAIERPLLWYYTPMAYAFSDHVPACGVVYDCMDELSHFLHAPRELVARERALLARADVVFTGGHSLYLAKRGAHPRVHPFPSCVDVQHFAQARGMSQEPPDQASLPGPRIGFYGVIDERLDIDLLDAAAIARPDWQWILLGPVAKIDPARLPQRPNVHVLGRKSYEELPCYLGGWDVAMMPFAINAATRFISPTKTPEYLAGGCPVASTPVRDVVAGYGDCGLVHIGDGVEGFLGAVEAALAGPPARSPGLCARVDELLRDRSWTRCVEDMRRLIAEALVEACPAAEALQEAA